MGQILVRGLDDALLDQLKARAKASNRSVAAEMRMIVQNELERAKARSKVSKKTILELAGSHPSSRTTEEIVADIRAMRDEWDY